MPLILTLTLVVAFSFLVSRLLQRYAPRSVTAGSAYILLGVLVGPEASALLTEVELALLQPFVSLTLGILGFMLGLPLVRQLKSVAVLEAGLLSTILTVAGLAAASWLMLETLTATTKPALAAVTLGAAGAATALPALRAAAERFGAAGMVTSLVQSFALVGNVLAVLLSGIALAHAGAGASAAQLGLGEAQWLLASVALGIVCGLLFHSFVRAEASEERIFLATVGVVVFASGMASGMGISPLVLNALAGVTVAIATGPGRDHSQGLERIERPAFIVLMIFAGTMWSPIGWASFVAPVGFFAVRTLTLRWASSLAVRLIPRVEAVPRVGNGLVPMGGIAVAIAVNYVQVDLPGADLVSSAVLGATILAELIAMPSLRRLWVDAGEVSELAPPLGGNR